MPKYWGEQIFTHGRFPKVGLKQKTEREKACMAHASRLSQNLCYGVVVENTQNIDHTFMCGSKLKISYMCGQVIP